MEYSESCAILLLCLPLPQGPLHVLLEGVVDHEQLLAGVVDHVQLLAGVVDHELLLARLGMYTTCCRPRRNDRKKEKLDRIGRKDRIVVSRK